MRISQCKSNNIVYVSFACVCIALFVVCGLNSKNASAAALAYVRVIHASPDVGTADVFLDGKKLLSNFQFGTVTGYAALPSGSHKVQIAVIGKGPGAAVITQTIAVNPGLAYTVAAIGKPSKSFALQVYIDNNLVAADKAKVRIYNLAPGTNLSSVQTGATQLLGALPFEECSDYLSLNEGSYTFDLMSSNGKALPFSTTLVRNKVTSVFTVGLPDASPTLRIISTTVDGLPGMPGTGSDPNAPQERPASLGMPGWYTGLLIILLFAASSLVALRVKRCHA